MIRLLTITEAADVLHLSENLVRGLCHARKLRHERHGLGRGKILIPEDAIEEYRTSVTVGVSEARPKPSPPSTRRRLRHLSLD